MDIPVRMITMSVDSLDRLITLAVDAGVESYMRSIEPDCDNIKQGEAKRLIKKYGFKPAMLKKWADARLILPVKTGERNAAVWYSRREIKRLMVKLKSREIGYDDMDNFRPNTVR